MHKRFILRGTDYKNPQRKAEIHDEVYKALDEMFTQIDITEEDKIDTKFFTDEIVDNFLEHDAVFNKANLDIWINRNTRDVEIKITHNGRPFNPLTAIDRCENIKAAASRLTTKAATGRLNQHLEEQFGLAYNLK